MPNVKVTNLGNNKAEIWLYDDFGPEWAGMISANWFAQQLKELGPVAELTIRINSAGGDVFEAAPIYNLLKNHDANIIVEIDGMAFSCASWVAMAGDTIRAAENAVIMIHDPSTYGYGTAGELRSQADVLDVIKSTIVGVYAARTQKTPQQVAKWMNDETWFNATEAKDAGFVTEISPNKSPVTMHVDRSKYKNLPAWIGKPTAPSDTWQRSLRNRQQLLNEISIGTRNQSATT